MTKLFISYNRADLKFARDVATELQARGYEITMDTVSLVPGTDWRATLDNELRRSDVLIALLTHASIASQFVAAEIGSARAIGRETGRMLIIPVVADEMSVPALVNDLFAVIAPNRDVTQIATEIHRAITSFKTAEWPRSTTRNGPSVTRDRTIGLLLSAAVVLAFIAFLFVPPERLNSATLPIVRFLAALAAALAAYLFIGSMTVGGQMPFFSRLEVKAAGSFAAFFMVLLLFFRGLPTSREEIVQVDGKGKAALIQTTNSPNQAKPAELAASPLSAPFDQVMRENPGLEGKLGVALGVPVYRRVSLQPFTSGFMLWVDSLEFFVLADRGHLWTREHDFTPDFNAVQQLESLADARKRFFAPERGFFKVWVTADLARQIGWPEGPEYLGDSRTRVQTFEHGFIIYRFPSWNKSERRFSDAYLQVLIIMKVSEERGTWDAPEIHF